MCSWTFPYQWIHRMWEMRMVNVAYKSDESKVAWPGFLFGTPVHGHCICVVEANDYDIASRPKTSFSVQRIVHSLSLLISRPLFWLLETVKHQRLNVRRLLWELMSASVGVWVRMGEHVSVDELVWVDVYIREYGREWVSDSETVHWRLSKADSVND